MSDKPTVYSLIKSFLMKEVRIPLAKNEFGQDPKSVVSRRVDGRGPNSNEIIASGLAETRWDAWTDELSTEWVARALKLAESGNMLAYYSLTEQMEERDPSLHSAMMTRRAGPLACEREMKPAVVPKGKKAKTKQKFDDELAKEISADTQWVIDGIENFDSSIMDILDAIGKGVSALEIDWNALKDGTIDSLRHVNPRLYNFDQESGDFYINDTKDPLRTQKIFIKDYDYKFILHRSKMRAGHACRAGVLRTIAWCYVFRNYAWKDQSVYCEIFGMPMRIGKYKPTATPGDKNQLATMLKQMASNAWALISESTIIEFEEATNRGQEPFSAFLNALRSEYFLAILGQEGTNVTNKYGSKGDTQIKQLVRQDILEADCKQLESTLKWQLLYPIVLYRWGKANADLYTPLLHFRYEPALQLAAEAEIDKKMLVDAGLGTIVDKKSVAEKYGYKVVDPDAPDEDRIMPKDFFPGKTVIEETGLDGDAPAHPGQVNPKKAAADHKSGKADKAKQQTDNAKRNRKLVTSMAIMLARKFDTPEERHQGVIDQFIDQMTAGADDAMRPIVAPLLAAVIESKNYEELRANLQDVYEDLDTDSLQVALGWSMMMARLFGQKTIIEKE